MLKYQNMSETEIQTHRITVAEMPVDQYFAPSAELDKYGRPLSVGDLIRNVVEGQGYRTWVSPDGVLSQKARDANTALNRSNLPQGQKAAGYMIAIRAEAPYAD